MDKTVTKNWWQQWHRGIRGAFSPLCVPYASLKPFTPKSLVTLVINMGHRMQRYVTKNWWWEVSRRQEWGGGRVLLTRVGLVACEHLVALGMYFRMTHFTWRRDSAKVIKIHRVANTWLFPAMLLLWEMIFSGATRRNGAHFVQFFEEKRLRPAGKSQLSQAPALWPGCPIRYI